MSMSRYQLRNRSVWAGRGRHIPDDWYSLDPNKTVIENAFDIFRELSTTTTTESRRLSLLSGFVKLLAQDHYYTVDSGDGAGQPSSSTGGVAVVDSKYILAAFSVEDYLYCLSASLVHQFTQIRAASLRAIRHLIRFPQDVATFNELQLPHLLCRSFDVVLDNEEERMQVIKLIRKMLSIAPTLLSPIIVRPLVALGDSVSEDSDRMLRVCLVVLCELGVLHPTTLIVCGGVGAITRNVLDCHSSPRIAESLVGVLLHLLERAATRRIAGVRLDCLAAPYCDFTYRLGIMDKNKDARDLRFTSSRLALLSVFRSWAGTLEFCDPNKPSGLKAIVDVLYLNQLEVRRAILDLLYELVGLQRPTWTDELKVALESIDPGDFHDSWRLCDGFVYMEGRAVLPTLAPSVPNIFELHTAFLLYCFLETGLLNALVEVVVTGDTFISVRTTMLLGKLLQLMHTHLPAEILNTSLALPTLISYAIQGNKQAKNAIASLQRAHNMFRNRPIACSLFLNSIVESGPLINSRYFRREIDASEDLPDPDNQFDVNNETLTDDTLLNSLTPDTSRHLSMSGMSHHHRKRIDSVGSSASTSGDERQQQQQQQPTTVLSMTNTLKRRVNQKRIRIRQFYENLKQNERLMRESLVLSKADQSLWEWEIILKILRTEAVHKMDDTQCRFIRALVNFFKPSTNRFSHMELGSGRNVNICVTAGLELIDWLLQSQALECIRLLTDLFSDINTHLMAILTSRSAHDCLFSPHHMSTTMCQQYFLFIGRMCRSQKGLGILNNTDIFERLSSLVNKTIHVCYIKLIVSGLDYTYDDLPRSILEQAMKASERRAGRLYATQFMLVLLRAKIPNIEVWGLPLLIAQTKDPNRAVAMTAVEILDEAAHDRIYLEELVNIWPRFDELGDMGHLLMTRFYSIPRGLNHPEARLSDRIEFWANGYNKSYVLLVEADTHSALTLHTKNEDGAYNRRSCSARPVVIPPNLPPHLFGQLVQTTQGLANLIKFGNLSQMCERLTEARCSTDAESLALKEAIWALSHASTSRIGLKHVSELDAALAEKLIALTKHCDVYSVRATAFQALGLVGSTKDGADLLYSLDWLCVRRDRNTPWPISEPENWLAKQLTPVRHPFDEVPPYNYTGIDENAVRFPLNGNPLEDSAATTSFFYDETTSDRAEVGSNNELDDRLGASTSPAVPLSAAASAARSRTLPEGISAPATNNQSNNFHKHSRSLSESKTIDGISLMGADAAAVAAAAQSTNRMRFNSGTDSNTSGVSSCESVYGRYMLPNELHYHTNTLSPIPSSSNLLEMKSKSAAAANSERFRRISLTGASFRENTLSPQDAQGYAQLRKLRFSQRPMFSESAAEDLADFMDTGGMGASAGDGNVLSLSRFSSSSSVGRETQQQRRLKVRSLDRHSKLIDGAEDIVRTSSVGSSTIRPPMQAIDENSPCYSGICLPRNILDLFHTNTPSNTYISQFTGDADLQSRTQHRSTTSQAGSAAQVLLSASFSIVDAFNEDDAPPGSVSSLSDTSSAHTASTNANNNNPKPPRSLTTTTVKWSAAKHNRSACILCCRQSQANRSTSIDATDSAAPQQPPPIASSSSTSLHLPPRRRNSSQTDGFSLNTRTPSSYDDLIPPGTAAAIDCIAINDTSSVTDNILRQVHRMVNPVWGKQCKMALLEIKQKHPTAFQDVCLYAEVCRALGNSAYRLPVRRFLQELFLDLNFDSFLSMSADICLRREREFVLQQQVGGLDSVDGAGGGSGRKAALLRSTAQLNGACSSAGQSSATDGPPHGFPPSDHIYVNVKPHLRHPQLESVFETSVENLAESLGRNNKHMTSSSKLKSDQEDATTTTGILRVKNPIDPTIIAHRHSDVPKSSEICSSNTDTTSASYRASSALSQPMRPRFNTLELDLSCTKNKFPITDRRKQFQQQLSREKSPNSAPATPTEWSYQTARNGNPPHGFPSATTNTFRQPDNGVQETKQCPPSLTAPKMASTPKLHTTTKNPTGDTIH